MTLVVPCLENIFIVLLMSALENLKIGTRKHFLDSGSPRGEAVCGHVLVSLYSSHTKFKKKSIYGIPHLSKFV